jgi:hypothetical protein
MGEIGMRVRRTVSLLAAGAMVLAPGLVLGLGSVASAAPMVDTLTGLQTAFSDSSSGSTIMLGASISDTSGDTGLVEPAGDSLTLDVGGNLLTLTELAVGDAAINVPSTSALTIIDSVGGGAVTAIGGPSDGEGGGGAGIGGDGGEESEQASPGGSGGAVTITDATVTTTGGASGSLGGSGAGIGGGGGGFSVGDASTGGDGGALTVTDGVVTASGGAGVSDGGGSAGVGGGGAGHSSSSSTGGSGGSVSVIRGSLSATGSGSAAAAGGGAAGLSSVGNAFAGSFGSLDNAGSVTFGSQEVVQSAVTASSVSSFFTNEATGTMTVDAALSGAGAINNLGVIAPGPTGSIADTLHSGALTVDTHAYALSFNAGAGTWSGSPPGTSYVYAGDVTASGQALPTPAPPTFARATELFSGWNTASDGSGAPVADSTSLSGALGGPGPLAAMLYAQYERITAHVSSAHRKTRAGWYRSPVTVSFTCSQSTVPLTVPCPARVTRVRQGAGQSVSRTVRAPDGAVATVTVSAINIDSRGPSVRVTGARLRQTYRHRRHLRLHAADALSGVATSHLHQRVVRRHNGTRVVHYAVTVTDKAGNATRRNGLYFIRP